mmetsp:Transcript_35968/g.80064  ORF Transcript_35968/g.80064 Transcript_35968/m.80064 type:complete len:318 (+) Transcript_35968:237-1190(+)
MAFARTHMNHSHVQPGGGPVCNSELEPLYVYINKWPPCHTTILENVHVKHTHGQLSMCQPGVPYQATALQGLRHFVQNLGDVVEVLMLQRCPRSDPMLWSIHQHPAEEVHTSTIQCWHQLQQVAWPPLWKCVLVVRKLRHSWPKIFIRGAHDLKNLVQLIDLRVSWEEGPVVDHFSKDAANGPHVHRCGVRLGAQENLRGSIPKRHHLMCVSPDGNTKCSSQTKVSKLQVVVCPINQQVLWLQVTMEDPSGVAVCNPVQDLPQIELDDPMIFAEARVCIHELFQVQIKEFKDKVEPLLTVNDVVQPDYICMVQFLQK